MPVTNLPWEKVSREGFYSTFGSNVISISNKWVPGYLVNLEKWTFLEHGVYTSYLDLEVTRHPGPGTLRRHDCVEAIFKVYFLSQSLLHIFLSCNLRMSHTKWKSQCVLTNSTISQLRHGTDFGEKRKSDIKRTKERKTLLTQVWFQHFVFSVTCKWSKNFNSLWGNILD
jgi:hypothetical protein